MSSSASTSSDSNNSVIVEAGLEGPIDNFYFRQCPAEFKLKITGENGGLPTWTNCSTVPKDSLLHISHSKGTILFPHHEKGTKSSYFSSRS